jgi:hydroxymethylglutaryl-CoA reductase (NADPH)
MTEAETKDPEKTRPSETEPGPGAAGRELVAEHEQLAREQLARDLATGARGFHQLPLDLDPDVAASVRRRAAVLRAHAEGRAITLEHVGGYTLDAARAASQHCENFAGAAQIPLGLVGPLLVRGDEMPFEVLVPMATTEGALLASVNRGCRAITAAGGALAWSEEVGMTRAPVFRVDGIEQARRLLTWLEENAERVRRHAEGTSRFLRLLEIRPQVLGGTTVFLRFRFATGDAMGMNMVTIACDRVVRELIEPETGVRCVALSGNYCVDKKSSQVNFQLGRGRRIVAEVVLPRAVLERTLKTEAGALVEVTLRKNLHGSIAAGAMGFNAQFANVLAALFVATGQDLAHVVEGAMGLTHFEERAEGAVYASVTMPDVPLAAIGGGTALATQREALALLGVTPDPERPGAAVRRLAEVTGAVVLAGELSLMAAFTSNDLARAHERLARDPGER